MEYDQYLPSELCVMLTVDQFVGRGGGPLERQKQDSHVYRKNWHIASNFSKKKESSPHKRRSLRICEKDMESLMCDGCEGEYNKQLCES